MASIESEKYGERLLPNIVDQRARSGYDRPVAMFPKSHDVAAGFRTVSYVQLANAVNRACWWLEETMPSPEEKEGTFAYFGPNDLRYLIFLLATMKTSRKILIASMRNTVQAQLGLFEKANCKVIVSCHSLDQSLQPLFTASGVRQVQAPTLDDILDNQSVPHYEYKKSPDKNVLMIVHTSGSSGNPKPIFYTHGIIRSYDAMNILPKEQGESLAITKLHHQNALSLLPCFHAGGLGYNVFSILLEMTIVLGHPEVPMTAQYAIQLLKPRVVTTLLSPPSILAELADDPSVQEDLVDLKHIAYAGGPLRPVVGEKLAKIVPHLCSYIGATECGWFHTLNGNNEVWDSINFYSDLGYKFEEISPDIFEMVIVRDERTDIYQHVFQTFPGINEYRTRDLYSPNKNNPGWWKYRGRADDLIVLSNGEKINPIPLENIINSHSSIKAALVIGEYRFIPSLLVEVEPKSFPKTEKERHELLEKIWPVVQEANKNAPGFSKIPKSLILFTDPEKPFLRAGKGTVQRQLTVRAYADELEHLYQSQQSDLLTEGLTLTKSATAASITTFVREIYAEALEADDLSDTENVFQRGLDSLRVAIIVQRLRAVLAVCEIPFHEDSLTPRLVYSAWSVESMTEAILALADIKNGNDNGKGATEKSNEEKMKTMLEKYTKDMPPPLPLKDVNVTSSSAPWTVILTGTTGSLGSYLLAHLQSRPLSKVSKIYCLNRSSEAQERQKKSALIRGFKEDEHTGQTEFLQANFDAPNLGLGTQKYDELLKEATCIIHSAWKVDFNLTLESFESQIQGVHNILDFSIKSINKAPMIFISSISTALNYLNDPSKIAPEKIIHDFTAPENLGYGQSKFICEHLLDQYSKATGLKTAVFRTGQIAGPLTEKGVWNKQEWFPSLIASSKYLGALPESLGNMEILDWIPVDLLSSIMIELTEKIVDQPNEAEDGTSVYNLVNPKTTKWSEVRQDVQKSLGIEKSVSLQEWVSLLAQSSHEKNGAILENNPAVKLLDFFKELSKKKTETKSRFEVEALIRDSDKAAEMTAVSTEWLELWVRQWKL